MIPADGGTAASQSWAPFPRSAIRKRRRAQIRRRAVAGTDPAEAGAGRGALRWARGAAGRSCPSVLEVEGGFEHRELRLSQISADFTCYWQYLRSAVALCALRVVQKPFFSLFKKPRIKLQAVLSRKYVNIRRANECQMHSLLS